MWLVVVGAIVIALIAYALGYDMTTKPRLSMQEYRQEQDELVNRWLSGNHRPNDEQRMFEEFYEGDVDAPEWN
jgi:hypothetical protein